MSERRLGKGLSALLSDAEPAIQAGVPGEAYINISINQLDPNPYQPRKHFDEEMLRELADSIALHGVVQPLVVSQGKAGRYILIAGERRWRAARMAGLREVPAVVRELEDRELMEVSLIENLQREDLTPVEEALAMRNIMEEFSLTQEELAGRLGKSRSAVANTLRLLALPEIILEWVNQGMLTAGHARTILSMDGADDNKQIAFAREIMTKKLSVREAERLAGSFGQRQVLPLTQETEGFPRDLFLRSAENGLRQSLGTKVSISGNESKGRIIIEYYSADDLNRFYEMLHQEQPENGEH